jgi:hypothetical protein
VWATFAHACSKMVAGDTLLGATARTPSGGRSSSSSPRTAVLGALLLTGCLGGAVASQVRIAAPTFNIVFPIAFAVLAWGATYLLDARVRALLPVRPPE